MASWAFIASPKDPTILYSDHEGNYGKATSIQCNVYGWAADPDDRERDVELRILADDDPVPVATAVADLLRKDVYICTGGTCGFLVKLWGLISPGETHQITVQAFDLETESWVDLENSPKQLACWGYPEGYHGGIGGNSRNCSAFGWAADPDDQERDVEIRILVDDDPVPVATTVADLPGVDVRACKGGTCGFSVELWGLISAGETHRITVPAFDLETESWMELRTTPKYLACWSYPEGYHDGNEGNVDSSNCSAFGWAADPDDRGRDLRIRILADDDPDPVATTVANLFRGDVSACKGGTCGFSVDLWGLISAGETHQITVQAFDLETSSWVDLGATPKDLACHPTSLFQ
jgi:hypothetical protein